MRMNYRSILQSILQSYSHHMSDSLRPHGWQPARLSHPWDSPDKNTGVGCHFLLQSMKVKSECEVAQSRPTLRDPMDCSLPGSSVHGIFPGKSTGMGCHCLISVWQKPPQYFKVISLQLKGINKVRFCASPDID